MTTEHPFAGAFPDPNAEKEKDLQAEIERRRYEKIMATKDGRWVMWELLEQLGFRGSVYGERHAGKHDGAVQLADTLRNVNLELYHAMIVENDK